MSDLVERLRNWSRGLPKTMILSEAADRIEALEAALRPTQDYLAFLRRSVNVGPLTNNPTKEAALLKRMMEATDAALAPEQDK